MSPEKSRPSLFCISTYEKGQAFLVEAARLGCEVRLLTVDTLANADWPRDALTEFLTMPEDLTPKQLLNTVAYLARTRRIDRVVALDEFDLANAALLREHMRLPGLTESGTRFFRDKLAMRTEARSAGIRVPEFTGVFHYGDLAHFMRETQGPWLLKPRMNASAIGIKAISDPLQLWPLLDHLADEQSDYVLERFVPGEVFHCEGITWKGSMLFSAPFQYGRPPIQTMHMGGVFTTRTLHPDTPDARAILAVHARLLPALHMDSGVSHSEFIKSEADGDIYFLETAARVGGAYIAEALEFATGLNPWKEWAAIETALARKTAYVLPKVRNHAVGSIISLARQETPDLEAFDDPEIVMRLNKKHHAGLLVCSEDHMRIQLLTEQYAQRFLEEFCAVLPVPDRPTS